MTHHPAHDRDGTVWLVASRLHGGFFCYWYTGRGGDHLVEHAHVDDTAAALAWGRWRTPSVRIRTSDARSYWAGSGPRPAGIAESWTDPDPATVTPVSMPPTLDAPARDDVGACNPVRGGP